MILGPNIFFKKVILLNESSTIGGKPLEPNNHARLSAVAGVVRVKGGHNIFHNCLRDLRYTQIFHTPTDSTHL